MKINEKPVTASGTLVVAPGAKAELSLPFGNFALEFNPNAPLNIQITTNPLRIRFNGTDNPLGVSSTFTVPLENGAAELALAIYAIGEGSGAMRIIHYTVS